MTINWFTIAAQILNFLVLVYLLKRFLYPAIIGAMDKREKLIASRLQAAEEKTKQATEAEASYNQLKQELATQRQDLTSQAREEAEKLRQELSGKARDEVDADKARWREAIKQQQDEFLRLLRERAAEQVVAIARRTLQDLADESLEQRIISRFIERLEHIDRAENDALRKSLEKGKSTIGIASAFKLPDDTRKRIRGVLQDQLGDSPEPTFSTSADLIGGIELSVGDMRIAWSLESYLDDLEQEVSKAVEDAA